MVLITVPEVLREKLGADGAQALVEFLDRALGRTRDDFALVLDTRFDVLNTRFEVLRQQFETFEGRLDELEVKFEGRLAEFGSKFEGGLAEFGSKFEGKLAELGSKFDSKLELLDQKFERRLAQELGKLKTSLVAWMFVFWATQLTAIGGALFAFFRFLRT